MTPPRRVALAVALLSLLVWADAQCGPQEDKPYCEGTQSCPTGQPPSCDAEGGGGGGGGGGCNRPSWKAATGESASTGCQATSGDCSESEVIRSLTYDKNTGRMSGSVTTNLCPGHTTSNKAQIDCVTQQIPDPSFPASDSPQAAPLLNRIALTLKEGNNIYGPLDAGFTLGQVCSNDLGECTCGSDLTVCEDQLVAQCGKDNVRYGMLMDACGGHAQPYHHHTDLLCDYDADASAAHSPAIAVALDGHIVYGRWEGADAAPKLDACNGHTGPVPADATYGIEASTVYHYHSTETPPYLIGCFGPVDSLDACKALYEACGNQDFIENFQYLDGTTVQEVGTNLWCPCYQHTDADGCDPACDANAECVDAVCVCNAGYIADGGACANKDECDLGEDGCDETNGACTDTTGSFVCSCSVGFELADDKKTCEAITCGAGYALNGNACEDVDECAAGEDSCDATNGECSDSDGSFSCSCNAGFQLASDGKTCEELTPDGCDPACDANAACVANACQCNAGFEGEGASCSDIDFCASGPCHSEAACTDAAPPSASGSCECNAGFEGDGVACSDMDFCSPDPCDPNAACADDPPPSTSGSCLCNSGFTGDGMACTAETPGANECAEGDDNCHTEATCTDTAGSFECACNDGFAGNGVTCTAIVSGQTVPAVQLVVQLLYSAEEFNAPEVTNGFKAGVAKSADTTADKVTINSVTPRTVSRRLLADAVDVDFSVEVEDQTAATALLSSAKLSASSLSTALEAEGVKPVAAVVSAPTVVAKTATIEEDPGTGAAGRLAAASATLLTAAALALVALE